MQDEVSPVMRRARVAVAYMVSKSNSGNRAGYQRMVIKLITAALDDMAEIPVPIAEFYMKQLAALMYYVAAGDWPGWIEKPEDFTA